MTEHARTITRSRALVALAGVIHFAIALWIFRDCLAPGLFPYGRDTVGHDILFFDYGWSVVRDTGLIPLWNHQLFAGWPWVAAAGWTPWYPPHWVALFAPVVFAFTLQYLLHHAWAGLGFTVWGRVLGLRFGPALLAGVLFQVSGHFTTLVFPGHLAKFEAIAWMPWILCASVLACERTSVRYALLAAICLAMQILTQHAQIVYYTVGLVAALSAWQLLKPMFSSKAQRSLSPLWLLIFIGFISGALALVQLLPATEMIRISNRAEGVSWEEAVDTSYPPEELVELAWPGLFGSSTEGTYHGRWGERLVSDYLGVVTLIGIILALLIPLSPRGSGDKGVRGSRVILLMALLIVSLLLALGKYTPLYRLLYDWLPGWNRWRSPATIMCVSTFAACTLAGMGWDALMRRSVNRWFVSGVIGLLVVGAVADETRVARHHVIGISHEDRREVRAASVLSGHHQQSSVEEIELFSPPFGRAFLFTQEYSNALMVEGTEVITGYHPILLGRYQRMIETMGYNNPNFHRLLGVTVWGWPPQMPTDPQYDSWPMRHFGTSPHPFYLHMPEGWQQRSLTVPGEMLWVPAGVIPATTPEALREALRAFETAEDNPFGQAVIESPGLSKPVEQGEPRLGSEMIRDYQEGWNGVTFSPGEETYALWKRTQPAGLGHRCNAFTAHVALGGAGDRWVVLSQFAAPGWRFHGNDLLQDPNRIGIAWDALMAVRVDGPAVIEAVYRPATVRLGLFVSLISLAFVLALLIALPKTSGQTEP